MYGSSLIYITTLIVVHTQLPWEYHKYADIDYIRI